MNKRYLVEFVGTFFLTMAIMFTGSPYPIGFMLTAMIYMGGHISGGHFNPAVTLAVWLRGGFTGNWIGYMLSQVAGAFAVNLVTNTYNYFILVDHSLLDIPGALFHEALFAFVFCTVFLTVATTPRFRVAGIGGIVMGFTLVAIMFIEVYGCVNSAVGFSSLLFSFVYGDAELMIFHAVVRVVGPLAGAFLAALWFAYLNPSESRASIS